MKAFAAVFFLAAPALAAGLQIQWQEGPEYPMGIQDSAFGVVHGLVISAGGFTRHPKDVVKKYPDAFGGAKNGFTKLTFLFDPAAPNLGWRRIPDLPGPARQAALSVAVDGALYAIGGFNYTAPYSYRSTYRLERQGKGWRWTDLKCDVPWPMCEGSAVAIGGNIYVTAAADYFRPGSASSENFYTESGRGGSPVGRALLELDTRRPERGWSRLADLPGVPRAYAATAAIGGKIYVLGGLYAPFRHGAAAATQNLNVWYYNAEGNWVYLPSSNSWEPLPTTPDNANARAVAFAGHYLITIGGFRYAMTWRSDGTQRSIYGAKAKDYTAVALREHPSMAAAELIEKEVSIYDTDTGSLERASPLLDQSAWPVAAIDGGVIYCLGGEGGSRLWHPATFQIGTIRQN